MKLLYISLVLVLLVGVILTGCGKASPVTTSSKPVLTTSVVTTSTKVTTTAAPTTTKTADTPQYGGTLRLIDDRPPSGAIGWFAEPGPPAGSYFFPMFEGLARAQYDGSIKPLLAASWEFSSDLTSATFHLHKNVTFQSIVLKTTQNLSSWYLIHIQRLLKQNYLNVYRRYWIKNGRRKAKESTQDMNIFFPGFYGAKSIIVFIVDILQVNVCITLVRHVRK